jgi:hypothetical protein
LFKPRDSLGHDEAYVYPGLIGQRVNQFILKGNNWEIPLIEPNKKLPPPPPGAGLSFKLAALELKKKLISLNCFSISLKFKFIILSFYSISKY